VVRGQRKFGRSRRQNAVTEDSCLRSSAQWGVDAGSSVAVGDIEFLERCRKTQMGVECAGPGYISARLLLTPASLIEDVVQLASTDATGEAARVNINEQLGQRRANRFGEYQITNKGRAMRGQNQMGDGAAGSRKIQKLRTKPELELAVSLSSSRDDIGFPSLY
jgi:hypothetical protein